MEAMDQKHDPAANRFLNSLGFGESVLQNLQDTERAVDTISLDGSSEERNPAVMLSSQADEMTLPGADSFSKATPIRRGGLQDIVRKQSDPDRSPADESFSSEVSDNSETVEIELPQLQIDECEAPDPNDIPSLESVSKKPVSQIISVSVHGREIRKSEDSPQLDREEGGMEEEEFTQQEPTELMTLSCPTCDGELTLQREHLGVEGNCVWCETSIVAAESGADGEIRIFLIQSDDAVPDDLPIEETASLDQPKGQPLMEESEEDTSIEEEKPGVTPFSSLSDGSGFADLPSVIDIKSDEIEVKESVQNKIDTADSSDSSADNTWRKLSAPAGGDTDESAGPESHETSEIQAGPIEAPPELPSASTFAQLGHEAAWSEAFPETPKVDEAELEKFPFLDPKTGSKDNSTEVPEKKSPESIADFASIPEAGELPMPQPPPSPLEPEVEPVEGNADSAPLTEPFPKPAASSSSPFADFEKNQKNEKTASDGKMTIPDDVLSFLGSIEPDNDKTPEEGDAGVEVDTSPEQEAEPVEQPARQEVPSLSTRELRKDRRAKKNEAAQEKSPGLSGPLPAPGGIRAEPGAKMPGKTKIGLLSIAGVVVGLGVASFFIPVQEYVDRARDLMSEAFNKRIGLDSNSQPPTVIEINPEP